MRFVNGPLDGMEFDPEKVNKFALPHLIPTPSGNRLLLLVPSLDTCERVLRGEMRKEDIRETRYAYERTDLPDGRVELRFGQSDKVRDAMRDEPTLPRSEVAARQERFRHIAASLVGRLKNEKITAATEVDLLITLIDDAGTVYPPQRENISTSVKVSFAGDREGAAACALAMFRDNIAGNLQARVSGLPAGPITHPDCPGVTFYVHHVEYEITQA